MQCGIAAMLCVKNILKLKLKKHEKVNIDFPGSNSI